jgi:hypothetical protein
MSAPPPVPAHLEAALVEARSHRLRASSPWSANDPGVTIKQLSLHCDESARKVRHQIEQLGRANANAVLRIMVDDIRAAIGKRADYARTVPSEKRGGDSAL